MRCRRKDDAEDEEECCENYSRASPESVDGHAEKEHAEDFTDEVGIGEAGFYGGRDAVRIPGAYVRARGKREVMAEGETLLEVVLLLL